MAVPVYLFTGFLDSGKTTLIKDTLCDPSFMDEGARTLILCFEQGESEYSEKFLDERNAFIEYFDDPAALTVEKLHELDTIYHPDQIFMEWNGTVAIPDLLIQGLPDYLPLVQILTTVDASTFEMYMGPLRQMMYEQLRYSDTIICNRCDENTSASMLRGNIKAINKRAQIYYEGEFGEPAKLKDNGLPFNIDDPILDIKDDDYGLWYMDAVENPAKYAGKEIILRGFFAEPLPGYKQSFILGRRALVCCEADTSLCGITVTGVKIWELKIGDWIEVQGILKPVSIEGGGETVVLYANRVARYEKPENEFVTFS